MPRAVQYERWGDPSVLEVVDVDEVHPLEGRVRLAVRAAGLNPFDFKMRSGLFPPAEPKFPRGIGGDVAGVVDEVGEGAVYADGEPVRVGDEVLGWGDRTLREQLVVPAKNLARKPAGLSWAAAGGLATAALTAHAAVVETLGIHGGDVVLVSAAAGAVGFFSVQLARQAGARVVGTASERNFAMLESIGVVPVTYGPFLADRVRAALPGATFTAVQDNHGREAVDAGIELGVPRDRIITIVDHDATRELGLRPFGPYQRSAQVLEDYAQQIADGRLAFPIERTFPLDEVRDAFGVLEGRHLSGKVVVLP
jgi:NADPH:quinone reductase-like Zn-dependent oxidoreductase